MKHGVTIEHFCVNFVLLRSFNAATELDHIFPTTHGIGLFAKALVSRAAFLPLTHPCLGSIGKTAAMLVAAFSPSNWQD